MRMEEKPDRGKKYLFDNPIEIFVHKHAHFRCEEWPEFFCVYGFVACVVLVIVAKYILRPLVMRREDYYD